MNPQDIKSWSAFAEKLTEHLGDKSALSRQESGDHYKDMAIQPLEFITRNNLEFLPGCVIKRMCRYKAKDGKKDLLKAIHEIQCLIELEYPECEK